MKIDFSNHLRNGRTISLVAETSDEAKNLAALVADLREHPHLALRCDGEVVVLRTVVASELCKQDLLKDDE
jgi:hypothetical protein